MNILPIMISAVLGGVIGWFERRWWTYTRRHRFLPIAKLRGKGITIRIRAFRKLDGEELKEWLEEASKWEHSVPDEFGKIPQSEARRIKDVDKPGEVRVEIGTDPKQIQLLANLSATVERLDSFLERHEPRD